MPGRVPLVSAVQVRIITERFKATYPRMGKPRFLVYVNRELVEDLAGMKKSARPEHNPTSQNLINSNLDPNSKHISDVADSEDPFSSGPGEEQTPLIGMENRYRLRDRDIPTLADKQTALEMERWFARPLRSAGATITDLREATQLIGDSALKNVFARVGDEQARKDREALKKITDIVVEILIAPRHVPLPGTNETKTYVVPDLQATATRLSDSKIIGQIASSDVLGRVFSYAPRTFDAAEITEVTALALMEDLLMQAR